MASSFILLVLAVAPNTTKADTDWIGAPEEHGWFNADNWSNGVPKPPANGKATVSNGGTAEISGGDANADSNLFVDQFSTVTLSAGSLTTINERLGPSSTGNFTQSGGTNQATNLSIGYVVPGQGFTSSGTGNYDLIGGALNMSGATRVGEGGTGILNQTGGNHTTGLLTLGGRVEFLDGTTSNPGIGTYILSGGNLNVEDKTEVGLSGKGIFTQGGGTHTTKSLYVGWAATLPSGRFSGFGDGTYNLYSGTLSVSGTSQVGFGGSGTFNHTGGIFTTETLNLGIKTNQAGGSNEGIYNLSDTGSLTVLNENVGFSGTGKFNQFGGMHTVSDTLTIGQSGGQGTYNLSGGSLNTTNEIAGDGNASTGAFIQTGGTHTVSDTLTLGQFLGQGTYTLSGGGSVLTASNEYIGLGGLGSFTQTSGTHTINNTLAIGSSAGGAGGNGTYALNGGSLNAANEIIGDGNGNTGAFTQAGGTHSVNKMLTIGDNGSYLLSGGTLSAPDLINNNSFDQSGGAYSGTFHNNKQFIYSGGSFDGSLINEGTAIFNPSLQQASFGANISGTGSLTKQGNDTLILTGDNSYNGGTTVSAGVLQGNTDSLKGNITNSASVVFDQAYTATYAGAMSGTGSLTKQNGGTLILTGDNNYSGGTTVSGGMLQGNTDSLKGDILNNATVVFDQANTGTYTGTMSGEGNLIKQNSGLLVFNSANNSYAGGTEVIQGNLQVGDASHLNASISGPVMIDPTGILSGHGTINGNVNNSGILSPGGSIGTLYVNGNVNFTSNSIFNVEINPLEASLLNVSGQASLGNANVSVLVDNGTYSPHTYRILNANPVSGVFNSVNIVNAADIPSLKMLTSSLQFFPDHVNLSLDVASDSTGPGTSITDKWFKTTLRTVGGRLNAPLGKSCPQNSLGFWARGVGMISSADASSDASRYDGGTAGVVVGVDNQFGEHLSLGIAAFTAHTDATTYQSSNNQSTVNSGGVSLYGAYTLGAWQFKSVFGYDNDTYKAQRNIAVSSLSRQAQSKTYGNRVNNYTEASYSFKSGNLTLQPVAGLQLGWMRRDGFNETGPNSDGQNINVNGRTLYALDTLVGLRTRHELPINNNLKAQLELRTLYDHDFGTLQNSVAATLSNGQTRLLSTADRPTQRDAGIVGASVALLTTDSLNFYLDYNGEFRSGQQAHFISAGVRYSW